MWHTLGNSMQSKAAIIQQLRKREKEMGRSPCSKEGLNKGAWTADEDKILREYLSVHGEGRWRNLPRKAGLKRCGKSCRLRWLNYLRPDIKRGNISPDEQDLIIRLHKLLGNRWSLIAGRLPGRTDNEIKNYWNTNLGKKVKDHSQTNTRPLRPNENNTKNPCASKLNMASSVVRTKATKCSKVFLNPVLQHDHRLSMQWQNKSEAEADLPLLVHSASNSITTSNLMEPNTYEYDSGFLSFPTVEQQLTSDLLLGFNMGELCLPDLLNSDFSGTCDFSYSNNNSQRLSPSSDQPMVFSDEILKDSTQSGFDETNVSNNSQFLTSFLDSIEEWPGER